MAQALSAEEFQRLQGRVGADTPRGAHPLAVVFDLVSPPTELTGLRHRVAFLDKELAKAQKALGKSKKAQEVEALLSENEMLQGKLHSQEEDFRLQNSTLLQELSKWRQAENAALQENVAALQERLEKEVARQAEGQGGAPQAPGPAGEAVAGPTLPSALELKWETEREEKRLLTEQLQGLEAAKQAEISRLQDELNKLAEKLKKKQEGASEARDQLQSHQREHADALHALQDQGIGRDALPSFISSSSAVLCVNLRLFSFCLSLGRLPLPAPYPPGQVACQSAESQEQVETILSENDALRTNLAALEQIQTSKTQELNLLREQSAALGLELQQKQSEKEALAGQRDDLSTQLQESIRANSRLLEQLQELGQEKEKLVVELEEARKSADKRKSLLDAMAVETQQEKGRHQEALAALRVQQDKEVLGVRAHYERELRQLHEEKKRHEEELRGQLKEEKARSRELESSQQTVEELRLQIQSMDGAKGWFERRLKEAEELIEKHQQNHEEALRVCKEQHAAELKLKDQEVEATREQLRAAERSRDEHVGTISRLRQEVKDTVDGQRILEKKGSAALKDLKRQLQLERKRADKLQERLQEILTNSKTRTGIEELVLAEMSSPSRAQTGDSSSISSFSYREIMKEGSGPGSTKSNTGSPQAQRPAELSDEEISELFQRLAETQQEKWMLEEKVKHLEVSSSSMAEDLCRKSAIIETYVMDSRIGENPSVRGWGRPRGGFSLSQWVGFIARRPRHPRMCPNAHSPPPPISSARRGREDDAVWIWLAGGGGLDDI
nr:GRIP1-associated protein 1 [Chrysemys picta bellii]